MNHALAAKSVFLICIPRLTLSAGFNIKYIPQMKVHPYYTYYVVDTYCYHVDKYVVSQKPLIEVHVFNLDRKYHTNAGLPDVFLEHVCEELDEGKHPQVHKDCIEYERVHEGFIG